MIVIPSPPDDPALCRVYLEIDLRQESRWGHTTKSPVRRWGSPISRSGCRRRRRTLLRFCEVGLPRVLEQSTKTVYTGLLLKRKNSKCIHNQGFILAPAVGFEPTTYRGADGKILEITKDGPWWTGARAMLEAIQTGKTIPQRPVEDWCSPEEAMLLRKRKWAIQGGYPPALLFVSHKIALQYIELTLPPELFARLQWGQGREPIVLEDQGVVEIHGAPPADPTFWHPIPYRKGPPPNIEPHPPGSEADDKNKNKTASCDRSEKEAER